MEIVLADASIFRSSIDALKEFLPQAQLSFTAEGLRIRGMDVSHVGFVDYFLAAADCESYSVPAPLTIGLNMPVFARVLNSVGGGDRVTLGARCTAATADKFLVSYTNERVAKKAVYEVQTIEIMQDAIEIPDMSYSADVRAKTADVATIIKEVAMFGDSIRFRLDEEGFHVSATGDTGSAKQTLENTEDREMALTEDSVEALFGTRYISTIMKSCAPLSSAVQLEFESTQPLRASFRFGNGSHFVAYLAPKVDE